MHIVMGSSKRHLPHFRFLTGDINWRDYGGKWVGKRLHNGDWPYRLVIELINWENATGERVNGNLYVVSLYAVSPVAAGEENVNRALEDFDWPDDLRGDELVQVEALSEYGIQAMLWQGSGNNARKLLQQAREQAYGAEHLFGFYMDGPQNRIGSTGWDMIAGDFMAGLRHYQEAQEA